MGRREHHVVPSSNRDGWDVRRSGAERASGHYRTKREAIEAGRRMSRNAHTEFIVHNMDGKISGADSHANDPCPPHDKR